MSMRSFSRAGITRRLFNTPLAVLPSTAAIVLGVVGPRFDVSQLLMHAGGESIDIEELVARASSERAGVDAKRTSADRLPASTAADWRMDVQDGVAHINIRGELVAENGGGVNPSSGFTGYDAVGAAWSIAQRDPSVKGVLLDIDSPGGEVTDLNELAASMMADRGNKPSRAIIRGVGASAAYALACCCDEVTVQELGYAGSIGIITMHADFSGQLEQAGVKVTLIYAGAHKADGNPFEALPDDVRASIQADIDVAYGKFVSLVAAARGMSEDDVRATQAQIYQGQKAVDAGLADKVMGWQDSQAEFVAAVNGRQPPATPKRDARSAPRASQEHATMDVIESGNPAAENQPESNTNTTATVDAAAIRAEATTAERTRVMALIGLCATSTVSELLQGAIESGTEAGAFAIELATAAKARGASVADLKAGAVQADQLPAGAGKAAIAGSQADKKAGLLQRVAAMGHRGLTHINQAS